MAKSNSTNMLLSGRAVLFVKNKMTIGASNKASDLWSSLFSSEWSMTCVSRIRKRPYTGSTIISKLRAIASRASNAGCGNCGEQAAIAFIWLLDNNKTLSIDYMSRNNADHAFVVIGRNISSPLDEPSKWGSDCVICDPWDGKSYSIQDINKEMYGGGVIAPSSMARSN